MCSYIDINKISSIFSNFRYSKNEKLKPGSLEMYHHTHLIAEGKSKFSNSLKPYLVNHDVIDTIEAFHHLSFNYFTIPPIKIKTRPILFILRRRENYKEFLPAINGVEYEDAESVKLEGSQEHEHRKEVDAKEAIIEEKEKNENEDNENSVKILTKNQSKQKTETATEESKIVTETIHADVTLGNLDIANNKNQDNVNKKLFSTKSSSDKTDTDKSNYNIPEDFRETSFLNKKIKSLKTEERDVGTEEIEVQFSPKSTKKIVVSTDQKINPDIKVTVIKEDTDIQKPMIFRAAEKQVREIQENKPKEVHKKVIFSARESTVTFNEIRSKDTSEQLADNSEQQPHEISDKPVNDIKEAETILVIEKKLNYKKLRETMRKSKGVSLDKENLTKKTLKKVTSIALGSDQAENEMAVFTPKHNKTTQNVKQTIRTIIQKYKKEKFDKEYYSQPKDTHAKDNIKRIIDAEKIKEEQEEITKLEKQIMDLIENNDKIVNKNLIKGKIRDTIRTELINAIDYQVDTKPAGKTKMIEAKELQKPKFRKPKFLLPKKTIRKDSEQKMLKPIIKERQSPPIKEEPDVSEDLESFNLSDEEYLTGEEGIDSDSPVLAAFEDSMDLPTGISVENIVLEKQKLEFVKKFKKANEKLENIMTIIDEIVDTIEITDEDDLEYIR